MYDVFIYYYYFSLVDYLKHSFALFARGVKLIFVSKQILGMGVALLV